MRVLCRFTTVSIVIILLTTAAAAVDKQLVSGSLKKLNNFAKVAVCPSDGNALIVWSQGNTKDNSYGRIYASEARHQPDGSYAIQPYFTVGIGQRPSVIYLAGAAKYFIAWDSSVYDLNEYRGYYLQDQREEFLPCVIRARTYSPGLADPLNGLGTVVQLSDPLYELNVIANAMDVPDAETSAAAPAADRVFVSWLGSDESEYEISEAFLTGGFEAGTFGSTWDIGGAAAPATADIALVDRLQMLYWTDIVNTAALTCGFSLGDKVYSAGAFIDFNIYDIALNAVRIFSGGEVEYEGTAVIFRVDPATLTVEDYFTFGSKYYGDKDTPLSTAGSIAPLNVAGAPDTAFPIIGCNNVDFALASLDSDFDPASHTNLGYIYDKKTKLVDQRVVSVGGELLVIYHNKKGQFRQRRLSNTDGSPVGGAKTILQIKKKKLQWMDAASYGDDVLLVFAEASNKKNNRIYLAKFKP